VPTLETTSKSVTMSNGASTLWPGLITLLTSPLLNTELSFRRLSTMKLPPSPSLKESTDAIYIFLLGKQYLINAYGVLGFWGFGVLAWIG
jgi:hypothetical protein